MSNVYQEIASLSPQQRALFDVMLKRLNVDALQLPLVKKEKNTVAPLSSSQERFWFIYQFDPDNPAYNDSLGARIKGELNVAALEQSLNMLVQRHEILRTVCAVNDGVPVQQVIPEQKITVREVDLRQVALDEREAAAQTLADDEARTPFDLTQGEMVRCLVAHLDDNDHVLVMTTNHFVSDGFSERLMVRELSALYAAYKAGETPSLKEPMYQYGDYAIWEKMWLQSEKVEAQLDYWKSCLADAPYALELPTDHPRPRTMSFNGDCRHFAFSKDLSERLRVFSTSQGVTLFMTLLAAFQTLLHRYTRQQDILVGTPATVRSRSELEEMMGSFANNLVMRADFSDDPSFVEILQCVSKTSVEGYANQDLPFERLLEALHPQRDMSHTPIFQVMFMLHVETLLDSLVLPGAEVFSFPVEKSTARFDLDFMLSEHVDGLQGVIEYNTDLFESETVDRLWRYFEALLEGILADPDKRVSQLPMLKEDDQRTILNEWNTTVADYPDKAPLHELFEAQVERFPDKPAAVFDNEHLSYAELNQRANQLAHYLVSAGVGPDHFVGICVERSLDMLVGLLGILKAGGAYVPLDPAYPQERLTYMLDDCGASLVLVQDSLKDHLGSYKGRTISIDSDWPQIATEDDQNLVRRGCADDLAYVIYTSGSTGKPKGVALTHRSVVNFLCAMRHAPGMSEGDRHLAVTTISFDIAVLELYLPLITGATTVIASRESTADGASLLALIDQHNITVMQATPVTWRLLLESGWQGTPGLKVLCGGEAMPRALAAELVTKCDELWNLYGPTETTVWSMRYRAHRDVDEQTVLIGRPIENTQIYLLDENMQPVPVGVPGEIYIGGAGLARGYLNRPELTAERFVPNPFDENEGSRLYRTGDLAFYHDDGNVEYMRRIDNQVKVRGFRIELGEVESALMGHDAIDQAVVNVWENRPGDQRLVAYLIYQPGESMTVTEIRNYMRALLPEYMVPQHVVELDEFPVTPNGKLDRKRLPAPFGDDYDEDEYVGPETDAEQYLAAVWREALGVERISVHDNFFDLGGHSLLSMKVIERVRKETAIAISPRLLLMDSLGVIAASHPFPALDGAVGSERDVERPQREDNSVEEKRDNTAATSGFFNKIKNQLLKK